MTIHLLANSHLICYQLGQHDGSTELGDNEYRATTVAHTYVADGILKHVPICTETSSMWEIRQEQVHGVQTGWMTTKLTATHN